MEVENIIEQSESTEVLIDNIDLDENINLFSLYISDIIKNINITDNVGEEIKRLDKETKTLEFLSQLSHSIELKSDLITIINSDMIVSQPVSIISKKFLQFENDFIKYEKIELLNKEEEEANTTISKDIVLNEDTSEEEMKVLAAISSTNESVLNFIVQNTLNRDTLQVIKEHKNSTPLILEAIADIETMRLITNTTNFEKMAGNDNNKVKNKL